MLFFGKFLSVCYAVPPMHLRLMRHPHMCALMIGVQQLYALPPQSSPQKSIGGKFQLHSKQSLQSLKLTICKEFPEHSHWWLFRTLNVLRYGARLAEERRLEEEETEERRR